VLLETLMTGWRAEDEIYLRLGTETPNWCLAADSDTLFLAADRPEQGVAIQLDAAQLATIHGAKGPFIRVALRLTVLGARLKLYLVGERVNHHLWKGVASSDANFIQEVAGSVAQDGLSTAICLAMRHRSERQRSLS
jgi:hypothetical protein